MPNKFDFPHDPDLEPVQLEPSLEAPENPEPLPVTVVKPVITPADPERWQTVVTLERPLVVDGKRLAKLTVRCLTGREFFNLTMEFMDEKSLMNAVRAYMCGVDVTVLDALCVDDQVSVVTACRPFLPRQFRDDPDADQLIVNALTD